mmetsp:Transcript_44171/g.109775  ORF Transcript_44171/g.109775 Transcript_44171/m.109775 type:complete len:277 (+) Transcript_44171:296-1126(+)
MGARDAALPPYGRDLRLHLLHRRRRLREDGRDDFQRPVVPRARQLVELARRRLDLAHVPIRRHHLLGHHGRREHAAPLAHAAAEAAQLARSEHPGHQRVRAPAALADGGPLGAQLHVEPRLPRHLLHRGIHRMESSRRQLRAERDQAWRRPAALEHRGRARAIVQARLALEARRERSGALLQPGARIHRALQRPCVLPRPRAAVDEALRDGGVLRLPHPLAAVHRDHAARLLHLRRQQLGQSSQELRTGGHPRLVGAGGNVPLAALRLPSRDARAA